MVDAKASSFSVIIVTKDITPDIFPIFEQCLISVRDLHDVWVIHSGHEYEDQIASCTSEHNAHYMPFVWNGMYPKKRGWCLENVPVKHDWVFFLDADEIMSPDLIAEIERTIHQPNIDKYAGFFTKGGYIWNGMPLKYGLKNNKLALLHKDRMHYPIIDDLSCGIMGEIEGHYQPVPTQPHYKVGQLETTIDHYAFIDPNGWESRHERYAIWEAYMINNRSYPKDPSNVRESFKCIFRNMPLRPLFAFLHSYLFKMGVLDGKAGFLFARTRYHYYKMVNTRLRMHTL